MLPPLCRIGANTNAFPGGFRMWDGEARGNAPMKRAPRTVGKRATAAKKAAPAGKKAAPAGKKTAKPPAKKRATPRKSSRARKTKGA